MLVSHCSSKREKRETFYTVGSGSMGRHFLFYLFCLDHLPNISFSQAFPARSFGGGNAGDRFFTPVTAGPSAGSKAEHRGGSLDGHDFYLNRTPDDLDPMAGLDASGKTAPHPGGFYRKLPDAFLYAKPPGPADR